MNDDEPRTSHPLPTLYLGTQARESLDMRTWRTGLWLPYGMEHLLDGGLLPWVRPLLVHDRLPIMQASVTS